MYCQTWKVERFEADGGSKLVPLYRSRKDMMALLNCSPRQFGRYINGDKDRGWFGIRYLCSELKFETNQDWFSPEQQAALFYYVACIRKGAVKPLQTIIEKEGFDYERANELFKSQGN